MVITKPEDMRDFKPKIENAAINRNAQPFFGGSKVFPKLTVNAPNDAHEQQADAMADKVMRMEEEEEMMQAKPLEGAIQRKCAACEEEEESLQSKPLLRKAESGGGFEASPKLAGQLAQSKGGGGSLPEATQGRMGRASGADFSGVRVHTGGQAGAMSQSIQARAFTHGSDIYFNEGQYQPETSSGGHLLAHELAHVVQQGGGQPKPAQKIQRSLLGGLLGGGLGLLAGGGIGAAIGFAVGGSTGALAGGLVGAGLGALAGGLIGNALSAEEQPNWTAEGLKAMLNDCDGELDIWEKAKKANDDKDPTIVAGSGGWVNLSKGEITLDKTKDKCFAVQQLIQELSNLSRKADFDRATASALAGDLSRTDFIKEYERIEYEHGVKNVLAAFDACKDTWGCTTTPKEWAREAENFQDYYDNYLSGAHKENYGKWWDENCQEAYDRNHAER